MYSGISYNLLSSLKNNFTVIENEVNLSEPNFDDIQQVFLTQLKDKLPGHVSLVEELAETLSVSNDSAYRRIRGETALSIREVYVLSSRFGLSLDSMLQDIGNAVTFENMSFVNHAFDSVNYLKKILADLKNIASFEDSEIIYAAKDIPIFHLFVVPEIAMFKTFFWTKTIASLPALENVKFSLSQMNGEVLDLSDKILRQYNEIPSTEIWSDETITSLLKQIEYYFDCGLFEDDGDAVKMCDKVEEMLTHIKKQVGKGEKFLPNSTDTGIADGFKIYLNEVVLPDNTILAKKDEHTTTYLSHDVMNYLITNNRNFSTTTLSTIQNVIKRSSLISKVSERDRNRFFERMMKRVRALKVKIEA